eukprot:95393-Rhodomonas_salina.1
MVTLVDPVAALLATRTDDVVAASKETISVTLLAETPAVTLTRTVPTAPNVAAHTTTVSEDHAVASQLDPPTRVVAV